MPTIYLPVTSNTIQVVYNPPRHRRVRVIRVHIYNEDGVGHKVTILGARLDSNGNVAQSRTLDYTNIASGSEKELSSDVAVYDLDRGEAIAVLLDTVASSPVHVSVTYELQ